MGGSQRGSGGHWLRRHRRFRSGLWQNAGNTARIHEMLNWLGYKVQENKKPGSITKAENFLFATVLRTVVGTRQLLIKRVQGFIPRVMKFKSFVLCRLTTHTPIISIKEWNKLGNARSARQFWKSRSVIAHRIFSRERQHLKQCYR